MSAAKDKDADVTEGSPGGEKVMTFRDHLMELRNRFVRIALVLAVGLFISWEYRIELFEFLSYPVANALADNGIYQFQTLALTESIMVYLKTCFFASLVILSPYVFWEMWSFISPGLYSREKRFILPLTAFSVAFFLLGSAFAYSGLLPFLTDWLVNLAQESGNIEVMVTLQNTYSFAFSFLLMFGLVFELPLVLFFLALWGNVTGKSLLKFWRYFVVISFVVSGILTPPDPLSQIFMAVPVNVLYGFGVIVAYSVSRARESGRKDASSIALRSMALLLLTFLVITVGLFTYITGLPQKPLYAFAPSNATFVAGLNPRVLGAEKAVLGLVRQYPAAGQVIDRLGAVGHPLEDLTDAMLTADAEGRRALVLRDGGLGLERERFVGLTPEVHAMGDDVLVFGDSGLADLIAEREPERPDFTREEDRLLMRLEKAGPLWVWLSPESPARAAILGTDNASELTSTGAALLLSPRRLVVYDLPDRLPADEDGSDKKKKPERESRQNRIEARIEAARVAALTQGQANDDDSTRAALLTIGRELATLSDPAARARLEAALGPLLQGPVPQPETFPALSALARDLRGVSVRREEARITVTAELADEGLMTLLTRLVGTAPPAAAQP